MTTLAEEKCRRKRKIGSEKLAQTWVEFHTKRRKTEFKYYKCPICTFFHLATVKKKDFR
jgi:hypothetical protein